MANEGGPGFGAGLILGGIIGSLIGIVCAPQTGEESRAEVMEKTAGIRRKAEEITVEAKELLKEAIEEGKIVAGRMREARQATHRNDF